MGEPKSILVKNFPYEEFDTLQITASDLSFNAEHDVTEHHIHYFF